MRGGQRGILPRARLYGRGLGQRSTCKCKRKCVNEKELWVYKENLKCKLLCGRGPEAGCDLSGGGAWEGSTQPFVLFDPGLEHYE